MLASFNDAGFGDDCEFLYIDNTSTNKFDGYGGRNFFLMHSRGCYVVICHQDVLLSYDTRSDLEARFEELTLHDPYWAACGNAGLTGQGRNVIRITDPHGGDIRSGPFPSRVVGLDENFIVVRRCCNLAVTPRLTGFHLYGTELCTVAGLLGLTAYVVDFHLRHLSGGSFSGFPGALRRLTSWRSRSLRPRLIGNTCGSGLVAGSPWLSWLGNWLLGTRLRTLVYRVSALFDRE